MQQKSQCFIALFGTKIGAGVAEISLKNKCARAEQGAVRGDDQGKVRSLFNTWL